MRFRDNDKVVSKAWLSAVLLSTFMGGCSTRHWAKVAETELPPPQGERVLHTDRLVVEVRGDSPDTQCVVYEKYRPVCFENIRAALEKGLVRGLWPAFPEVIVGSAWDAEPSDYLLQVDVTLDALPPDDAGPGWSAGARSRFRLMREGEVLVEETLASRSRAQFPYGAPLAEGATEVVDATILHVAEAVSQAEEKRPDQSVALPRVASQKIGDKARAVALHKHEQTTKAPSSTQAKTVKE
jgi:hypothetical protein